MAKLAKWKNILVYLVIFVPIELLGFYFLFPEWHGNIKVIETKWMWTASVLFFVFMLALSTILIKVKWITINALNHYIPFTLSLISIFLTSGFATWKRVLIVFVWVILAFPLNICIRKIREKIEVDKEKK